MRTFSLIFACGAAAFAQAPAPTPAKPSAAKPSAAKPAVGAKPGVAKTGAAVKPGISPRLLNPKALTATAPPEFKVKLTTLRDKSFVIDVHRDWSPNGADRFWNMVKVGFFNGVRFYRVSPKFVVQFGVNPEPKVTQAWAGANIKDDPVKSSNTKGKLTFAKSGSPDSRTTQLFVNLGDNSRLDSMGFSPIGEVIEGMDVVEDLYSEYGEIREQGGGGPEQMKVMAEGEKYLKENFDKLDTIKSTTVIFAAPMPPPPAKKTVAPVQKKAAAK